MTRTINDKKSADSEAANPCPSLFGEDSGVNRAVIASWKKGVRSQATPSTYTFRRFHIVLELENS